MAGEPNPVNLGPLERLDLALASRLAAVPARVDPERPEELVRAVTGPAVTSDEHWITALLGVRGFVVAPEDVQRLLSGIPAHPRVGRQEHALVVGMGRVVRAVRARAAAARPPDGWFLVELFRQLTCEVPRFRNNELRRDEPWDALQGVSHPQPGLLRGILGTFDHAHRYRDVPVLFDALHPVRRAFRMLWRFARIAPFPDLNLMMAVVGASAYLASEGYPLLCPRREDREALARFVSGPPLRKVPWLEARMLDQLLDGGEAA